MDSLFTTSPGREALTEKQVALGRKLLALGVLPLYKTWHDQQLLRLVESDLEEYEDFKANFEEEVEGLLEVVEVDFESLKKEEVLAAASQVPREYKSALTLLEPLALASYFTPLKKLPLKPWKQAVKENYQALLILRDSLTLDKAGEEEALAALRKTPEVTGVLAKLSQGISFEDLSVVSLGNDFLGRVHKAWSLYSQAGHALVEPWPQETSLEEHFQRVAAGTEA